MWGYRVWAAAAGCAAAAWLLLAAAPDDRLAQHRNLGKAFYENPVTPKEAVEEFRKALELAPGSARERVNYGIALLRAGKTREGIAELERAQKQDPSIPHTWFNLGIAFKREGDYGRAAQQLEGMARLVPNEPVTHYNLAVLHKLAGRTEDAVREFETAERLNPNLAGPHFQLYNAYRQAGRAADAARELAIFQQIKKRQQDAAVPEDMEWSYYAEIYDPIDSAPFAVPKQTYDDRVLPGPFAGVTVFDGSLLAWSPKGLHFVATGRDMPIPGVVSVTPGDFDNDGKTDLCIITASGAALYRNGSQVQTFPGRFNKAVWIDYDHDYDLDLVLLGPKSVLMRNNGPAGFAEVPFPFVDGEAIDGTLIDFIADTDGMDLAVSYRGRPGVLYRDHLAGKYTAEDIPALPAGATGLEPRAVGNDNWTGLVAGGIALRNNRGKLVRSDSSIPLLERDFDADGRLDWAEINRDGALVTHRNTTRNPGNWTRIALTGIKNLKLAYGARVEVKAGAWYQKQLYPGYPITFPLGPYTQIDTVRITWPNGLVQNEPKQPVNRLLEIKEAQRLSGSCPMIFTWDGEGFQFLTDVLGVAPLGASSGDGKYFPVDHDEYVQIPADRLQPRNGRYEIRMTEELREVSYLDQIRLIALDHPAGLEIFTNDKFKAPPFPEFRLFGAARSIRPVRTSGSGEFDFGRAAPDNRAVLILKGWVDWPDASTFLQASQAGRDLVFPYLQVKDGQGRWRTVVEDMGVPSGKPKTIAVDLAGKFLSESRAVRIVTSIPVHWDDVFLIETNAAPEARLTPLDPLAADLHFRGFSRLTRRNPEHFAYPQPLPASMWNPTPGLYTRYGDVRDLLTAADDRMVIMGSGDELRLSFRANLAAPPTGWTRDFLLLVDGWAKDGDANTAFSQTVAPLPFHAMSHYGEPFPNDAYAANYNTRPALRLIRPLTPSAPSRSRLSYSPVLSRARNQADRATQ